VGKLYIVGLGLTPDLITLRGLRVLNKVKRIFLETYTNIILDGESLEDVLKGKEVIRVGRRDLEDQSGKVILDSLAQGDVALIVPGDPLTATTHISLVMEALKRGYEVEVIPGVGIIPSALTLAGLMIYKLGKIITMVYPKEGIVYEYPYDVIKDNDSRNLHTLLLLELDAEKNIVMSIKDAIHLLYELEERRGEGIIKPHRSAVAVVALGSKRQSICYGSLEELSIIDEKDVPQTLIITSPKLHFVEEEMLRVINNVWCKYFK